LSNGLKLDLHYQNVLIHTRTEDKYKLR